MTRDFSSKTTDELTRRHFDVFANEVRVTCNSKVLSVIEMSIAAVYSSPLL